MAADHRADEQRQPGTWTLKGDRRGLRLVASGFRDVDALLTALDALLAREAAFVGSHPILVEIDGLKLDPRLLAGVSATFAAHAPMVLAGIHRYGLDRPLIALPRPERPGALIVRHALRSGQAVEHGGDIVVLGDVKPGARVTAGGDIFVLGRLRGDAAAGQPNEAGAAIFALRFEPTQVRIGRILAIPGQERGVGPEVARVEDGRIVVSPWSDAPIGWDRRRAADY